MTGSSKSQKCFKSIGLFTCSNLTVEPYLESGPVEAERSNAHGLRNVIGHREVQRSVVIVVTAKPFTVDGQIVRVGIAIGRRSQIELNED